MKNLILGSLILFLILASCATTDGATISAEDTTAVVATPPPSPVLEKQCDGETVFNFGNTWDSNDIRDFKACFTPESWGEANTRMTFWVAERHNGKTLPLGIKIYGPKAATGVVEIPILEPFILLEESGSYLMFEWGMDDEANVILYVSGFWELNDNDMRSLPSSETWGVLGDENALGDEDGC